MALTEMLLACAALLAALSCAIFTVVAWVSRPRYRRGRQPLWLTVIFSSSALPTRIPSPQDEGSSLAFHSPRIRNDLIDGPVADVESGSWVGGAEVSYCR